MRRAAWRALPQDPRSPLAWWASEAQTFLGRFVLIPGIVVGAFLLGWALHSTILGFGGLAFAALAAARALARAEEGDRALALLAPLPAPAEAFPVAVELYYQGTLTGRDRGIASLVEGWLYVEGLRTGFSLRPIDVANAGTLPGGWEAFELAGNQLVQFRTLGSPGDGATFREAVRVWRLFTAGGVVGEPLLPSLRVHASAVLAPLTGLAFAGLVALLLIGQALGRFLDQEPIGSLFPALIVAFVARKAVLKLRTLKAIDRLGREVEEKETLPPRRPA